MVRGIYLILLSAVLAGCIMAPLPGQLGQSEYRRLVVLNRATQDEAGQYANQYNAKVFYTQTRGVMADAVTKGIVGTVGPSRAMKQLMNELRSISNTSGEWEIIVPGVTERYFLVTLRNMEDNAVSNSSGEIRLVDSTENSVIAQEVNRVLGNSFKVVYGK